jgi:hypothetical protein
MEQRLNDLKLSFSKIIDLKDENTNTFMILDDRITKIKDSYQEFIKNNKQNLFVFGLDSFHFQGKLIDIEYEDIKRLFNAITNRMYCEYYKLYKIIIDYINENVNDKKILEIIKVNNTFPVYKDLEPFKQYDFTLVQNLHEIIITTLQSLCSFLMGKEHDLKGYQNKNKIGLNIDNFVNTFNFNNVVMKEKLILFITYIEFFHKLHNKYLKRFTTKIQLMLSQVNYDIKFDDTNKNDTNKKNVINSLKGEVNKEIIKELKSNMLENDILSVSSDSSTKNSLDNNVKNNEINSPNESLRSNSDASDNYSVENEDFSEIKLTSPKVHFNVDDKTSIDLTIVDCSLFEMQNPNDECLSGLTNESKDENMEINECKYNNLTNTDNILEEYNSESEQIVSEKNNDINECNLIEPNNEENIEIIEEPNVGNISL